MVTKKENFIQFMKRYGYLIAIGVLLIAVVLAVVLSTSGGSDNSDPILTPDDPNTPVDTKPITFANPLDNLEIIKDYSATALMFNKTLKKWEAHKWIDLKANEGDAVYSVLDGTVESIDNDYLRGTIITIVHDDGIKTMYGSLGSEVGVAVGDKVTRGQKIATASNTAQAEKNEGVHLHFEVLKDNVKVNPNEYLNISGK